jgi:hypothetical protein
LAGEFLKVELRREQCPQHGLVGEVVIAEDAIEVGPDLRCKSIEGGIVGLDQLGRASAHGVVKARQIGLTGDFFLEACLVPAPGDKQEQ